MRVCKRVYVSFQGTIFFLWNQGLAWRKQSFVCRLLRPTKTTEAKQHFLPKRKQEMAVVVRFWSRVPWNNKNLTCTGSGRASKGTWQIWLKGRSTYPGESREKGHCAHAMVWRGLETWTNFPDEGWKRESVSGGVKKGIQYSKYYCCWQTNKSGAFPPHAGTGLLSGFTIGLGCVYVESAGCASVCVCVCFLQRDTPGISPWLLNYSEHLPPCLSINDITSVFTEFGPGLYLSLLWLQVLRSTIDIYLLFKTWMDKQHWQKTKSSLPPSCSLPPPLLYLSCGSVLCLKSLANSKTVGLSSPVM